MQIEHQATPNYVEKLIMASLLKGVDFGQNVVAVQLIINRFLYPLPGYTLAWCFLPSLCVCMYVYRPLYY